MSRPPSTTPRVPSNSAAPADPAGIAARRLAVFVVDSVTTRRRTLDEAFNEGVQRLQLTGLSPRDRGFARAIAIPSLRHYGRLLTLVEGYLEKPLPADAGRASTILVTAAAQLILLDSPSHAAVSMAVDVARRDASARRFDRLINAILRRIAADGKANYATLDPTLDCPDWLFARWRTHYGDDTARQILVASLVEPPLDLSVKTEPETWASTLTGVALPTGSVRVREAGRVEDLPGFADGAWWVQDAAAALPARLLAAQPGETVADLCAAPGGKTAQLIGAGARVVAVDASPKRMARLNDNLTRLGLTAETIVAEIEAFVVGREGTFDAVLLDAPCSATGTIRRHPDMLHLKQASDIAGLAPRQAAMLSAAVGLLKPGGRLVYATCSLEREEGEGVVEQVLAADARVVREPLTPAEAIERLALPPEAITAAGDLRTLPHHALGPDPVMVGLDGFYAARLRRI